MKIRSIIIFILLITFLFLISKSAAYSKVARMDSSLVVLKSIVLGEHKRLDFGVIEEPVIDVDVHVTTVSTVGSKNTANHLDTRTIRAGKYRIYSTELSSISMNAYDVGNIENMKFKEITAYYRTNYGDILNDGMSNLVPPRKGGTFMVLGAVLEVKAGTL